MKKRTTILLCFVLLIFSVDLCADQKEEKFVFGDTVFKLNYPDKNVRVVLFSILNKDPLEIYKETLRKRREFLLNRTEHNSKKTDIAKVWGDMFSPLSAIEVAYLENSVSGTEYPMSGKTNIFAKQWLVTRLAIGSDDNLFCWGVPFRPKKGKTVEIILTKDNVIDYKKLEKIYNSIVEPHSINEDLHKQN